MKVGLLTVDHQSILVIVYFETIEYAHIGKYFLCIQRLFMSCAKKAKQVIREFLVDF